MQAVRIVLVLIGILGLRINSEEVTPIVENDHFYDLRTERCCMGVIHPITKPRFQRCCGTNLMDMTKSICCKNTVIDIQLGHHCCGNTSYDTDTQVCCNGIPHPKTPDLNKCCGTILFNSETHVCCSTKPTPFLAEKTTPDSYICCGKKAYGRNSGLCCGSTKTRVMNDVTDMKRAVCCGNQAYDANSQRRCCYNRMPYDPSTHICCIDKSKSPAEVQVGQGEKGVHGCCGSTVYDRKTALCCGGKIISKPENGRGICCPNL